MAKFEEITTFNLDNKTYATETLSQEGKDLLKVYMQTEDDIVTHKIALVQLQHAIASMGNMFRDMIKDLQPIAPEQLAAQALIASTMEAEAETKETVTEALAGRSRAKKSK